MNSGQLRFQGIIRENQNGQAAAIEFGFLRWLPTDNFEIRAGRMSLPVFLLSDHREVGYANLPIRPPEDVYSQIPINRFDGADITFDTEFNDILFRAQFTTGSVQQRVFQRLDADNRDILGLNFQIERGPIRARLGYTQSQLDVDSNNPDIAALHVAILQTIPVAPVLAEIESDFSGGRRQFTFDSVGLAVDYDFVFADFEDEGDDITLAECLGEQTKRLPLPSQDCDFRNVHHRLAFSITKKKYLIAYALPKTHWPLYQAALRAKVLE